MIRHTIRIVLALAALAVATPAAQAQDWYEGERRRGCPRLPDVLPANQAYDGQLTFARIRFEPAGRSGRYGWGRGRRNPGWGHDYPCAERNLMTILNELTAIRAFQDGGNIFEFDDPELFKYPIAYVSEPGGWVPDEDEIAGLRAYLAKGGFVIFDDFSGRDWMNFAMQMRRVLPDGELIPLDESHPVFRSFFQVESLDFSNEGYNRRGAEYYGVFEDNDPTGRLMVVVNYNNDIGDYWEYTGTGFYAIDPTNEALKLGVNYIVYALTH